MSKEIAEYILNNYTEVRANDVCKSTTYPYKEVIETFEEMRDEMLIEWNDDTGNYVIKKLMATKALNEIGIRDFENKKNQLNEFSKSLPKEKYLPSVQGGSHWYGASIKATGDDLNDLTEKISNSLIEQNQNIISVFKEFKTIYATFDALDKDYIQRILVNLEAAKEANRKAIRGLEENQKVLKSQKKVIEVLKKHKSALDSLKYLEELDEFHDEYQSFRISQEQSSYQLINSQKEIKESLVTIQKQYDDLINNQDKNNIKYLWGALGINIVITIIFIFLVINGSI